MDLFGLALLLAHLPSTAWAEDRSIGVAKTAQAEGVTLAAGGSHQRSLNQNWLPRRDLGGGVRPAVIESWKSKGAETGVAKNTFSLHTVTYLSRKPLTFNLFKINFPLS